MLVKSLNKRQILNPAHVVYTSVGKLVNLCHKTGPEEQTLALVKVKQALGRCIPDDMFSSQQSHEIFMVPLFDWRFWIFWDFACKLEDSGLVVSPKPRLWFILWKFPLEHLGILFESICYTNWWGSILSNDVWRFEIEKNNLTSFEPARTIYRSLIIMSVKAWKYHNHTKHQDFCVWLKRRQETSLYIN